MRLGGKIALITGSNRGVGKATAKLFIKEGANVVINYANNDEQAEKTLEEIKSDGGNAIIIKADVSKKSEVDKLVDESIQEYGGIDILINNAGILGPIKPFVEYSEDEWDKVVNVNLKGPFLLTRRVIPEMMKKGKGKIINISTVSILGERNIAAYCASKGGLASLTKTLSLEYADKGININAVCPGAIDTEMMREIDKKYPGVIDAIVSRTPSGRLATPEDIANATLYLASSESDFVNGLLLFVDGSIMNNVW